MIPVIDFQGQQYPALQSEGFAAQYALPFAEKLCKGTGYDIGCNRAEWSLPGSILIDPQIDPSHDAMNLPELKGDYIFSSHCLEHLPDWVGALDHWATRLKRGGVLFLYLPHPSQKYWLPWNNRKHIHALYPKLIEAYLIDRGWNKVKVTEHDLNNSFYAIAEKP